ncbi:MAG: 2-hydroxy-3-oxopropionate reductase [Christensenella sp.]|uniref:2-hydroxy-3-oxopropionate reductase n=1 Tax=Christensenella sp. TaxID=1935934 RepID=UPI002B1EA5AB|nr:2-hydroxy-3-oxopropionate reductase [Christensenella sp.]MEA5003287.1 2-hydroxy-3-oxopropionate reductase [Christensenella sp.]
MEKIGFIGLGIMGKPMAKNLIKAGYELAVYDVVGESVAEVAQCGARAAASIEDAVNGAEVVITMLPNSPQVKTVMLEEGGVLGCAKAGTIVVDMSSISPIASQEVAAACEKKGVKFLDAPVSGGEPKAVAGTLAIMVGGDADAFATVEDILLKMGSSAVLVGDVGSGNVTKLANQIIVALNIAAMSEAMVLAKKSGVDPEKVYQAIRGGLAGSTVLDAKMPMVLEGNFNPGFRIELHIKDLQNALDCAHSVNSPIPLTAEVMEIMQGLKVAGMHTNDHDAIIRHYERLAGVEVRR